MSSNAIFILFFVAFTSLAIDIILIIAFYDLSSKIYHHIRDDHKYYRD